MDMKQENTTYLAPNIVMVVADDTTPSYHGCYGGPTPTPYIDRLAREGIRMERGYGCASLCCPSRYTLFSGQYTQRSRAAHEQVPADEPALISQNGMLDIDTPTLAKLLQNAGYYTGHIGKWHSRFDTTEFGFDEPRMPEGDPDNPEVDACIRERQANAKEVVRTCGGFDVADRVQWGNIMGRLDAKVAKHNPAWFTDGALNFLDTAHEKGQPFYLHLANSVPHTPDCQLSFGADHRYTWGGKLEEAPHSHPSDESVLERMRAAGLQTDGPIAGVNAGQIQIDDQIGILLKKLEEMGELENTIFVYTADHGIPGKGSCQVTGQHLPYVMSWPNGLPQGRVVHDIFTWSASVPTLAEACGVSFPEDHILDGPSVLSALRGQEQWPIDEAYHEMGWSRSLIKGRYHYIATRYPASVIQQFQKQEEDISKVGTGLFFDNMNAPNYPSFFDTDQLYDLAVDPMEQKNLIHDTTRQDIVADLKKSLRAVTDSLPRPFPDEPDHFLETEQFQTMLVRRKEEVQALKHYPTKAVDIAHTWFANVQDPDVVA